MELFEALAANLGDEWRQVAESLGINKARVQAIKRDNAGCENAVPNMVLDMLACWYKSARKNCNKVNWEIYNSTNQNIKAKRPTDLVNRNQCQIWIFAVLSHLCFEADSHFSGIPSRVFSIFNWLSKGI